MPEDEADRLEEVRRLVRIISWDWVELVEAVRELKSALEPEDFQTALEAAGIVESAEKLVGKEAPAETRETGAEAATALAPPATSRLESLLVRMGNRGRATEVSEASPVATQVADPAGVETKDGR